MFYQPVDVEINDIFLIGITCMRYLHALLREQANSSSITRRSKSRFAGCSLSFPAFHTFINQVFFTFCSAEHLHFNLLLWAIFGALSRFSD
jgi:hypothetical protein